MIAAVRRGNVAAGLIYLVVLFSLLAATLLAYNKAFTPSVPVTLLASNAGNSLQRGADVKMRGVLVGRVSDVSSTANGAALSLQLDPGQSHQIPADVQARLLPKTLFGERYVSLIEPAAGDAGQMIRSGQEISEDRSAAGVELQKTLDDLLPLLQAVQPEKLASTLGTISAALRGRGATVGSSMTEFSAYIKKLNPDVPKIADDLQALASVADTYNGAAPELLSALDDLTTFAQTQVDQKAQLSQLYATVISSANTTGGWLGENSSTIIALSRDSLPNLDVTARYASEFPCTLTALTGLIPKMDKVLGAGTSERGLHGTMTVVPSRGKYVAGKDVVVPGADGAARCPYVPTGTAVVAPDGSSTAVRNSSTTPAKGPSVATPGADTGLGLVNSPAENEWIAELVAPSEGVSPGEFPGFGSLLLGPALRGSVVTLR